MTTLYILCGLPFSGKSLLAKEMAIATGATLISYDDVWQTLSYAIPDVTYELALQDCQKQIKDLLQNNFSVIYDSTNAREEHRQFFISLAKEMHAEPVVVYLSVPIEEIKNRRAQSLQDKTHHVVSDENFMKSIDHLEPPTDAVILDTEESKKDFIASLI